MSDQQQVYTMGRIAQLLLKRLKGESTPDEDQTLDNWLGQQDLLTREYIDKITEPDEIQAALAGMACFNPAPAFDDVIKRIEAQTGQPFPVASTAAPVETPEEETPAPVISIWKRYRFLVAASLLTLVAGSYLILHSHKTITASPAAAPVAAGIRNDVAPGGDKAILKLADGSSIILDSAANGTLAQQGNAKIVKTKDGQVAYTAAAATAASTAQAPAYNTISTPRGGQYQIRLADGTKVWLNAASSISFPTAFSSGERKVTVTGEAYFDIAKDPARPFKVSIASNNGQTSPQEIEVLGTEFNIMAYSDEAVQKTTLVNGAVKIISGSQEKVLHPGQQARIANNKEGAAALSVIGIDPEEVTAWKNGLFQFQDATIESIMRQAARWYDVEIVYQDDIKQEFIGKIPRSVSIATLLKILESTGWVHFAVDGKKITVMK